MSNYIVLQDLVQLDSALTGADSSPATPNAGRSMQVFMYVAPLWEWQRIFLPFSNGFSAWIASSYPTNLIVRGSVIRTGLHRRVVVEDIRRLRNRGYCFLRGADEHGKLVEFAVPTHFLA